MEENPMAGVLADEQEDLMVEYDNEGNIIYLHKNKVCNGVLKKLNLCFETNRYTGTCRKGNSVICCHFASTLKEKIPKDQILSFRSTCSSH